MASLHFYRYFFDDNDKHTNLDLVNLLDHVGSRSANHFEDIQLKMGDHWDSLSRYYKFKDGTNNRFFWIDKSMINNPYTGPLGSNERDPVQENNLYNPASCLLIPLHHLLIIFQPQGCPSYNEISEYLTDFVYSGRGIDDKFKVVLQPLTSNNDFNNIGPKDKIKNIYFEINPNTFNAQGATQSHNVPKGGIMKNSIMRVAGTLTRINQKYRKGKQDNNIDLSFNKSPFGQPLSYGLINYLRASFMKNKVTGMVKIGAHIQKPGKRGYSKAEVDLRSKGNTINNGTLLKPFRLHDKNPNWPYIRDAMVHFCNTSDYPASVANHFNINTYPCIKINSKIVFLANSPKNSYTNIHKKGSN